MGGGGKRAEREVEGQNHGEGRGGGIRPHISKVRYSSDAVGMRRNGDETRVSRSRKKGETTNKACGEYGGGKGIAGKNRAGGPGDTAGVTEKERIRAHGKRTLTT